MKEEFTVFVKDQCSGMRKIPCPVWALGKGWLQCTDW